MRHLVVSVHDVSPSSRSRVEHMLDVLGVLGVTRRSLLVIPNARGESPIDRDEAFCAWLRGRQHGGDEIVLHGYQHVGVGVPRNVRERFRNRWFTQSEGEFLSLDYDQAMDRIARGRLLMERAGFDPQGFVAPAWLINETGLRALRDSGFQYTNSYLMLRDLVLSRSHFAPSLVFGPGHLNEDIGIALQQHVSQLLTRCSVVRVVLHPPCVDHPARMERVVALIKSQLLGHRPVTYLELLTALRSSRAAVQGNHAY